MIFQNVLSSVYTNFHSFYGTHVFSFYPIFAQKTLLSQHFFFLFPVEYPSYSHLVCQSRYLSMYCLMGFHLNASRILRNIFYCHISDTQLVDVYTNGIAFRLYAHLFQGTLVNLCVPFSTYLLGLLGDRYHLLCSPYYMHSLLLYF